MAMSSPQYVTELSSLSAKMTWVVPFLFSDEFQNHAAAIAKFSLLAKR